MTLLDAESTSGPGPATPDKGGSRLSAGKIRDRYREGSRAIRPQQYTFAINQSFLRGEQWIYHDRIRNTINELPRDPERVRSTVNRLWPTSRIIMSKLFKRELVFEVQPTGPDDSSVAGAHLAQSVLQHLVDDHRWEDLRQEVGWATWKGGTALLALEWDSNAGTALGYNTVTGKNFGTGDIIETALTIAEVATEPGVRDIEKARWWIKAIALPPEQVKETYRLKVTPKADSTAAMTPSAQRLLSSDRRDGQTIPMTLVLTYFERPSNTGPGQVAVVVGEDIVDSSPWPFPFKDRLNIVCFRETRAHARWTGDTVVTAAVPVQAAYNASWSSIIEHMKLCGNARIMSPMGALDHVDELTDLPAEIVEYVPMAGAAPAYLSPPQMPQWWIEEPVRLAREMDDILGVHDVSRGQAPPNINSGAGLSILAEQDETPVGGMARDMASGFSRFATLVLKTYEAKVTETRTARVNSPGQVPQLLNWTGKALEGQTNAVCPVDAIMPRSREVSLQNALNLWDRKLVQDPKVFAKIAELSRFEDFTADIEPAVAKARRENHELSIGGVCIPAAFDDHRKHIVEHNDFRMQVRYEQLPPATRETVDKHVKAHEVMEAEAQARMLSKSAVSPALGMAPTAEGTPMHPTAMAFGAEMPAQPGGGPPDGQTQQEPPAGPPPMGPPQQQPMGQPPMGPLPQ